MSRRLSLSLLVVRGDGARVLRITLSPRLVTVAALCVLTAGAATALLVADWHQLRREAAVPGAQRKLTEQQAILDRMQRTVRELRQEIAGWRDVHARLLDTVRPANATVIPGMAVGGPVDRLRASLMPPDDLSALAAGVAEESRNLRMLDRLLARAATMLSALPSRWPVHGLVNSEFGSRPSPWTSLSEFHSGIDIRAPKGTPVRAPAAGIVSFAGAHPEYGLAVVIDHGREVKTIYGHLSKVSVAVGQQVDGKGSIGLTGSTGRSSGPHLHYEIVVQGQPVNPRAFLWD